jgi:RNA polymerase sigma-70 factor (ECF subfamily)
MTFFHEDREVPVDVVRVSNETELTGLVKRITAGDSAAEEEVIRRYKQGVAIVINQIVKSPSVTEDVSQDTFRIVLRKIRHGDLREPERLSGFVCSVARNAAIEHIRRASRLKTQEPIGNAEQIPDPAPSQLDQLLKQEKAGIVRQIINELKIERDRELLLRYYIAEEDKDQICADLDLSRAQFNNVVFRATARFKELYVRKTG